MKYTILRRLFLLVMAYSLAHCARKGTPTGGSKDSLPPVFVKAIPAMESTNFQAEKIKIYFDEYIKLKELRKNLVISPPQQYEPVIVPMGTASKYISIKILDTLENNTTYAFNFGNSVVDNNEGNALGNFSYVFATGDHLDSLHISGSVTDPMLKTLGEGVDVMLYKYDSLYTDSIIYSQKPRYIANTLDSTLYNLTHLKEGKYLLIALKDANNNKTYDPKTDKIGFVNDTVELPGANNFDFSLFKEVPDFRTLKPKEVLRGHLIFGYEGNAEGLEIDLLSATPKTFKSALIFDEETDTIHYWYSPFQTDSLNFEVRNDDYREAFTVRTRSSKIDSLKIQSSGSTLHLTDTFAIVSNTPIVQFDKRLISVTNLQDSIPVPFEARISKNRERLLILFEKSYDTPYRCTLLDDALTDIYTLANDSISYKTRTKSPEDYGTLILNFSGNYQGGLIVELLDKKEELVQKQYLEKPESTQINLLKPGTYFVRLTFDENGNGLWDTGSFLARKQAEKVLYIDRPIELRANWELSELLSLD